MTSESEILESSDIVNEIYTVDDNDYLIFIEQHQAQLRSNNISECFWKPLCIKIKNQVFDAGNVFSMFHVQNEVDGKEVTTNMVIVSVDCIDPTDGNNVYLIDHAWTFKANEARRHLIDIPGLAERMARMMNLPLDSENLIDDVYTNIWKFNLTYSCSAFPNVEDQLPVWYIMDEFGSAIQHSDNPNFRIVPFLHISEGITYSLLFPIIAVNKGENVTRDFIEGCVDNVERQVRLIPWAPMTMINVSFEQREPAESYFSSNRNNETLPNLTALIPKDKNGTVEDVKPLKVFADYAYINNYLTNSKFALVTEDKDADILWLTTHFKQYKEFSELYPNKFINQFPFECVLTVKDLLAIVCRRSRSTHNDNCESENCKSYPVWFPITYNLNTELLKFVSYFYHQQEQGLDNHWICKPWNLARSLDTIITNNLDCIIRLSSSGPKIVQKYIEKPVLFHRDGIGRVKFDIRYVVLLKSVKPLEVFIYKNFFLRFANKPFELCDFDDYEKHFTVMNYNENVTLYRLLCIDFIREFNIQYPNNKWFDIEHKIIHMFHEVFKLATLKDPPCGIGISPQSRALYAADVMLSQEENGEFEPKLLEINWTPDCQRACEYYENFYNDIFELLFLDQENNNSFYRLT